MSATALRPASWIVRVFRMVRILVHLLEGIATTALLFPLLRPPTQRSLIRLWSRRLLRMLCIDARVHGAFATPDGNVLLVANHVSWLDIFILNSVHPVRFVAKAELARWPVIGRMLRRVGTLFVERARKRDTRRVNHGAREAIANGDVVAVFPEGRTTDGTAVAPFKSSLLQPIIDLDGHVLPVAIRYRAASGEISILPAYVGKLTLLASLWRITGARSLIADLHVAPLLPAASMHRRDLALKAEQAIRALVVPTAAATAPEIPGDPTVATP